MKTQTLVLSRQGNAEPEPIDAIESLVELMEEYPLHPIFEGYGDFIIPDPDFNGPEGDGAIFWGNFWGWSHDFRIRTNDPHIICLLSFHIRRNQKRLSYALARDAYLKQQESFEELKSKSRQRASGGVWV